MTLDPLTHTHWDSATFPLNYMFLIGDHTLHAVRIITHVLTWVAVVTAVVWIVAILAAKRHR